MEYMHVIQVCSSSSQKESSGPTTTYSTSSDGRVVVHVINDLRVIQAIHTHQAIYGSGWPRSVNIRFWAFSKLWITPRNEVLNTIKPTFKVRWGFHVDENVQFQGIWNVARPPASFWSKRYSEFIRGRDHRDGVQIIFVDRSGRSQLAIINPISNIQ